MGKQDEKTKTMIAPVPGYALSILKEGQAVETRCQGFVNLSSSTPITVKTNFRLASLSKQFTAMAIMVLKERRLLNYKNTIGDFFSSFFEQGKCVTIRQLLTHTSGMPDHEKILYQQVQPGEYATMNDAFNVLKAQKKLLFPSAARYQYSDSGYVLLALIIENVSGFSYREFLRKNIFSPLKMKDSDVLDNKNRFIRFRAYGCRKKNERFDDDSLNFIVGDEGVYSSIEDMMKWNKAWDSPLLVGRDTLQPALKPAFLPNGKTGKSGFSWLIRTYKNLEIMYQDGEWVGFRNIFLKIPEKNLAVIYLSNKTDLDSEVQRLRVAIKALQPYL